METVDRRIAVHALPDWPSGVGTTGKTRASSLTVTTSTNIGSARIRLTASRCDVHAVRTGTEDPEDGTPYDEVLKDYMQSIGYAFGHLFIAIGS